MATAWRMLVCVGLLLAGCASSRSGVGSDDDDDGGATTPGDGGGGDGGDADGTTPLADAAPAPDASAEDTDGILHVAVLGADSAAGTPDAPLRTIAVAILRAQLCAPVPCSIRVSEGTYPEQVVLASGIDLAGGYAPGFGSRDPVTHPVIFTSDETRAVIADGLTAPTTLEGVRVHGADLGALTDGTTSHGLWVRDAADHLTLREVVIEGGVGARGVNGDDGELTACTALGGVGGEAYDCGGAGGELGDASGDPATGGSPGGGGGSNCPNACPLVNWDGISDGSTGGNGANGGNGGGGVPADDIDGAFVDDAWVGSEGASGARGAHGTGGSGGGSGGSKRFRFCFGCDTLLGGHGGSGAPGGCGGGAGDPGTPGGAAIGLTVIRSTILVESFLAIGGTGGRGGDGGDGHPGGPGGTDGDVGRQGPGTQQCGLITYHSGGGAAGGIGGHGGHGGGGPGGVGGASVAIAVVGESALVESEPGSLNTQPGSGGAGGFGGSGATVASAGMSGIAGDVVTY